MKKSSTILILSILVIWGCSSVKKLEETTPFTLGETYAQKWVIEDEAQKMGYEVIVALLSLDNDKAILKNLYHKGKMTSLEIRLTEVGNVAIAEFGPGAIKKDTASIVPTGMDERPFPFELTETQDVISYVNNEKVKYYKINGIRQNPRVFYPTQVAKNER